MLEDVPLTLALVLRCSLDLCLVFFHNSFGLKFGVCTATAQLIFFMKWKNIIYARKKSLSANINMLVLNQFMTYPAD